MILARRINMDLFLTIIISVLAGMIFGIAFRDKAQKKKINFWTFFIVSGASWVLTFFVPLLITFWCTIAVYTYLVVFYPCHQDQGCGGG